MSDLIERLERGCNCGRCKYDGCCCHVMDDAKSEITRLELAVSSAQEEAAAEITRLTEALAASEAENTALRIECDRLQTKACVAVDEARSFAAQLAASEEARRAERAAVVRECAQKAANIADLYDDEFGEDRVSDMIWGLHRDIEALATDADNAALDKLLREARMECAKVVVGECEKCNGHGWIWGHELDDYEHPNPGSSDDTKYTCDGQAHKIAARILAALEAPPPPTTTAEKHT